MNDNRKSKEQLLSEHRELKHRISELEKSEEDLKQVKSALMESEEKYRILYESSRDAIMMLEPPNWVFAAGNTATIKMFRAKDEKEFTSKKPGELSPEYQSDGQLSAVKAKKMIDKAMKTGTNFFEWTHKRFNGEEFPSTVMLTRVELKNRRFLEATVRDITDRKRAEEELTKHRNHLQELVKEQTYELQKSELQFRTLSDNIPGVVYLCKNDEKFTMIYINDEVEKVTGYKKEEFLENKINFAELFHPDDSKGIFKEVNEALEKNEPFHLNYRIRHKNGQWCYIEEFGTGLYKGNELQYLEGFLHDITNRIEAEEDIRKLSRAVEQSPTTIVITDLDGNIEYANPNFTKLTGYKSKDVIGQNPRILKSGIQSDEVYKMLWETISSGKIWKGEFYNKKKNGEFFWESASISPIFDKQGKKTNYVKVAVDITEHKKAEKKLKKSEEKLRNILDNSTNLFYSHTSENINIYQSPQVKKILGYEPEEVMVKWRELVSDNPVNKIGFELTEKAIRTGKPQPTYELELIHKTGRKVWVEVREAPVVEKGKATTIVGALTDITKRKRAEHIRQVLYNISNAATTSSNLNELIKLIHKQLGSLIDTTNFYIALYDEKSDSINLPYIADQGEKLTSFPAGKTLTAYVIKTKKPLLGTAHVINNLEESGEIELIGKLSRIWLGVPLKVEGEVIGVLVVQSYDDEDAFKQSDLELLEFVSDQISVSIGRKKAEEDIKSALGKAKESDRLKSVFLGTMSHEFRTPLNTVIGFSEIIDKDTPKEEVLDFVETINNSGKHLLGLVEDIFDISLIETGEIKILKEDFLIGAFMSNFQNFLKSEQDQAGKKNIEISYKAPKNDKNIMIFTDGRRLNQILINLLKNALKFTNKGYIEYGYSPEIMDDQSCLKFYVKDTGIGISKDKQKYIFDIFRQGDDTYTRRYEGIGIGLSVSKKLSELLGGKMWLESEVGKGSCFYFTLPFVG